METAAVTGCQRLTVAATGVQTTVSLLVQRCLLPQQLHLHHTYTTILVVLQGGLRSSDRTPILVQGFRLPEFSSSSSISSVKEAQK